MKQLLPSMSDFNVGYFSSTIFCRNQVLISCCNNTEWLDLYREKYHNQEPPVQKYLTSAMHNIIAWDFVNVDPEAKEYINWRNYVTNMKNYMTLLIDHGSYMSTFTFGSEIGLQNIIDYTKTNIHLITNFDDSLSSSIKILSNA
jgi:hypothetical protein